MRKSDYNYQHHKRRNQNDYDVNFNYATDWGFYDPLMAGSIDGTDLKPHDHGIVRALCVDYKPNNSVIGDSDCTIFVSRLNFNTNEDKLKKIFEKYGKIKRLRLVRDLLTGFSKGYAFIEYEKRSDAKEAHHSAKNLIIDEKEVIVEYELERKLSGWVPRRLGGGLGGRKESGQLRFGGRYKPFDKAFKLPEHLIEIKKEIIDRELDEKRVKRDRKSRSKSRKHKKEKKKKHDRD